VHPHVDRIWADDVGGACAATEHLLGSGADRVAMIQGPGDAGGRGEGYRSALEAAGVPYRPEYVVRGDWTRQGGCAAMRDLLALEVPPTAVFCANDLMAIGAMDAVHEAGLRIPEDVRLAGFDDIEAATLVRPALTTVRNPAYDTGRTAGDLLVARMSGEHEAGPRTVVLPCPLIVRASSEVTVG